MKVLVEGDFCIGDGTCSMVCPEIFAIDGDVAKTTVGAHEDVPPELEEPCRDAAELCPVMAIVLIEPGDVRFPDHCGLKRLSC